MYWTLTFRGIKQIVEQNKMALLFSMQMQVQLVLGTFIAVKQLLLPWKHF